MPLSTQSLTNKFSVAPAVTQVLLLHMDGTNGGTSFPDALGLHTPTVSSPTTSTTVTKFGTASGSFGGSDVLSFGTVSTFVSQGVDGEFISADCWVYCDPSAQDHTICEWYDSATTGVYWFGIESGKLSFRFYGGLDLYGLATFPTNTWTHVALQFENSSSVTVSLAQGGVLQSSGSTAALLPAGTLRIGLSNAAGAFSGRGLLGNLDEFRLTRSNLYSGATYTVPTGAYTP